MPLTVPRFTVADLARFPADGNRYELLDGVLLVTPQPGQLHQVVVARLFGVLFNALMAPGLATVVSPGVVRIGERTQLEPDLLVYGRGASASAPWSEVIDRWLAVEVESDSTRVYDREFKRQAYQAVGVEAVWLVDPVGRRVEMWDGNAARPRLATDKVAWRPRAVPDALVVAELAEVFRDA